MLTLPTLLFVSYWWLMPESTRWLITKGRYDEARGQVRRVARVNKVEMRDEQIEELIEAAEEEQKTAMALHKDRYVGHGWARSL